MKKTSLLVIGLLCLSMFLISTPQTSARIHGDISPLQASIIRRGFQKINVLPDGAEWEFSTSDKTYVWHGWNTAPGPGWEDYPHWSEMSGRQKREFLRTASFELSINGEPVRLRRYQFYDPEAGDMYVINYKLFPAYSFEPGTYTFVGTWYLEFNGVPISTVKTVHVTFI